jgi:type I restriction enzyme, S subunit
MKLPETWATLRLSEVCTINPPLPSEERPELSALVSFVPMSAIDETRAEITASELKLYAEVMRGYTPFRNGDVLFAKITPSMENGKAAIAHSLEGGVGFGSTEFHILRPSLYLLPEYLLYFLRQGWFRKRAAAAFVGSAGQQRVPAGFLARVKIPLPTIPEQQRIVRLLYQAEEMVVGRGDFNQQTQAILHAALDRLLSSNSSPRFEKLGDLVETRYGTSVSAEATEKSGLPVLRIPNVVTGEINTIDLKYVALPSDEVDKLLLAYGDVLIVRSNGNPNYVGRAAPVTKSLGHSQYVYASYLIRLRVKTELLRPEYLSCFINSPYGRAALRNAIRTTAGQSNVSGESLARIKIPVPPIEEQQLLADVWNSLENLRVLAGNAEQLGKDLLETIRLDAFSGVLTEEWRARNHADLNNADKDRRLALSIPAKRREVEPTAHTQLELTISPERSARMWLIGQLSEFQNNVRTALQAWKGTVSPDDAEAFDDFCREEPIEREENAKDRVRRTLEQLAALGLVVKVSLRNASGNFVAGFRSLRENEDTRLSDSLLLQSKLAPKQNSQETDEP